MTVRYTKDHEYVSLEGDTGTVGITDYAQAQLGDVVYVELPEIGRVLRKGEQAAVVESVKAASEVFSPVGGVVTAINNELEASPATVNEDAAGRGWFIKVQVSSPGEMNDLMTEQAYADYVQSIS